MDELNKIYVCCLNCLAKYSEILYNHSLMVFSKWMLQRTLLSEFSPNAKQKQKPLKLELFKSSFKQSSHIYTSVQTRWGTDSISARPWQTATSSDTSTVCTSFSMSPKVTKVSLSKLKLTLHLSMCIKAADSIAWRKLFFKQ